LYASLLFGVLLLVAKFNCKKEHTTIRWPRPLNEVLTLLKKNNTMKTNKNFNKMVNKHKKKEKESPTIKEKIIL